MVLYKKHVSGALSSSAQADSLYHSKCLSRKASTGRICLVIRIRPHYGGFSHKNREINHVARIRNGKRAVEHSWGQLARRKHPDVFGYAFPQKAPRLTPGKSRQVVQPWSGRVDLNHRPLGPEPSALNRAALRPDGEIAYSSHAQKVKCIRHFTPKGLSPRRDLKNEVEKRDNPTNAMCFCGS